MMATMSQDSVLWTAVTIAVFLTSTKIYQLSKQAALLHPMLLTTGTLIALILAFETSVDNFQDHTQILTFLLGPATVALAVPLYSQLKVIIRMHWRVILPIVLASILAPILSWTSLYLLDTPLNMQMSVLVKSITAPLAIDTAMLIGGIPSLAAVLVVSTGIAGAITGPIIFRMMKIQSEAAQGVALGSISHAIGTTSAINISQKCAAFSTLALCVNGISTSIILPILFS